MPRNVNPAGISTGGGTVAPNSVEDSSLRNHLRDTRPLEAHVNDPSESHMAVTVRITDSGGMYTSDEVEGALQEIGAGQSGGRTNGWLQGGTWTAVGNTLTLDTPSLALIGSSEVSFSGSSIALPDGTRWVYIDATTGNLTSDTVAPNLVNEPILVGLVVTTGGVINVLTSTDARFFVSQLDRKPALTLRETGGTNATAEGCFVTLEAALLYLQTYAATGASEAETQTIVVRGPITLPTTVTIPVPGIRFVGDGEDAAFVTGATLNPMFDVDGVTNTQFLDLTFRADHTGSIAVASTGSPVLSFRMERCRVISGAQDWDIGVNFPDATAVNTATIRDCLFEADTRGILIDRAHDTLVEHTRIIEKGAAGVSGIELNLSGPFAGEGNNHIRACRVSGFTTGASLTGDGSTISSTTLEGSNIGLRLDGGETSATDLQILLSSTTGVDGILADGIPSITGCSINCPRTVWAAENPQGITVLATASKARITGNNIYGFENATSGSGIQFSASSIQSILSGNTITNCTDGIHCLPGVLNCAINTNTISDCNVGIRVEGNDIDTQRSSNISIVGNLVTESGETGILLVGEILDTSVEGNIVDGAIPGSETDPTSNGILVSAANANLPSRIQVVNNLVWRCTSGIEARGTNATLQVAEISIQGNMVHHCAFPENISGVTNTYDGRGSKGIGLEWCSKAQVIQNNIHKIGTGIDNSEVEAFPNGGGAIRDVQSISIYARNCDRLSVDGNDVRDSVALDFNTTGFPLAHGIFIEVNSVATGADFEANDYSICDNQITWAAILPGVAGGGERGISLEVTAGSDSDTNLLRFVKTSGNMIRRTRRSGIRYIVSGSVAGGSSGILHAQINDNMVWNACGQAALVGESQGGIVIEALGTGTGDPMEIVDFLVQGNILENIGSLAATDGTGILFALFREANLRDISVVGNKVTDAKDYGIFLRVDSTITGGPSNLDRWLISNNTVRNTDFTGILANADGAGVGSDEIDGVVVQGNYVEDCTGGGIWVQADSHIVGLDISNNLGKDNGAHTVTVVLAAATQDTISEALSIRGNTDRGGPGVVSFTSSHGLAGLTVSDNIAQGFTGTALKVDIGSSSSGISITGNNLREDLLTTNSVGMDIDLPNNGLLGLTISNNTIRQDSGSSTSMTVDYSGAGTSAKGVSICGNAFYGATTKVTRTFMTVDGGQCSNNLEIPDAGSGGWGNGGAGTFTDQTGGSPPWANSTTVNNQD